MKCDNLSTDKKDKSIFLALFVIILAVFFYCASTLYFISQVASPLIYADAWYFLDTAIKKWMLVGIDFSDFFIKRGAVDHAQPLNKITLLFLYKFLHLDFRFEALVGFLGLWAIMLMFVIIYYQRIIKGYLNWVSVIAFISAISIITSINVTDIYTWPLVTFSFLTFLLMLIASVMTWRFLTRESTFGAIAITILIIPLIGDTISILLWISLLVTVVVFSLSGNKNYKNRAIKWVIATTIYELVIYSLINWQFFIGGSTHYLTTQNKNLISWFDPIFYMEIIKIVFSSSLVHRLHLITLGNSASTVSWVIALIVFGFYVRYFIMLFLTKKYHTMEKFLTTFILIYATTSVIAIIYGRVPVFGLDYLNQPRYVATYQLIPFALMMDFAYSWTYKKINISIFWGWLFFTAASLLLAMQFMFYVDAYKSVSSISMYYDKQAKAIGNYLIDPLLPAGNCTRANLTICDMSIDKRNELLGLLKKEHLNVLNTAFQMRYRLFPLEGKAQVFNVISWGPQMIRSTTNKVGIYIKLSDQLFDAKAQFIIVLNNQKIYPAVDGDVLAFEVPSELTSKTGAYTIELIVGGSRSIPIGEFKVY